jgi:hypothetical protein
VEKRAEVHLKWSQGYWAEKDFAVLHRLDYQVWDAWRQPSHLEGRRVIGEPPVLLTRDGVSYEMALAAVFRAISDEMPDAFRDLYLNRPARTGSAARLARVRGARSPN